MCVWRGRGRREGREGREGRGRREWREGRGRREERREGGGGGRKRSKNKLLPLCRTDELKRQYTGAVCGLGFDTYTGQSLYHEHDIEITFDTLITEKDLEKVHTAHPPRYTRKMSQIYT